MTTEPRAVTADDPLLTMVEMLRLHGRIDTEEANALERAHLAALSAPHPDPEPREALRAIADRLVGAVLSFQTGHQVEAIAQEYRRAALRAEPSSIDVERLARAMFIVTVDSPVLLSDVDMLNDPLRGNTRPAAKAVATEYTRLTQEATPAERTRE